MTPLRLPEMFFSDPASTENGRTKDPSVVRFEGHYWMYYTIWLAPTRIGIGIASSTDLRNWNPRRVLELDGPLEADGIAAPGAIVIEGKLHLFYQTYSMRDFTGSSILHAWSEDGLHFTRDATNPVVRPRDEAGKPYPWCNGRAIDADAFIIGDRLHLYYATRDPAGKVQMLGASSAPLASDYSRGQWKTLTPDGPLLRPRTPTPLDPPGLDLEWEGDCIEASTLVLRGGLYYMFYGGNYNQRPQQIGVAVSRDGLAFARMNAGQPILRCGPKDAWNGSESGHPGAFVDTNGRTYLFYQGCNVGLTPPLDWHLSMVPIKWVSQPDEPDLPLPDEPA
jgi:beta-1,2-mannobiose phosphorylase / 1,2-beta-oligomannan phosphorylase